MKRIVCVAVLACVVMGGVFAQSRPAAASAAKVRKNAIGMDLFPLFTGIVASEGSDFNGWGTLIGLDFAFSYERLLVPHFSIGADMDITVALAIPKSGDTVSGFLLGLGGELRYYPVSEDLKGLFVGGTLGLELFFNDGKLGVKDGGYFSMTTSVKLGYKAMTRIGLFFEPSIAYVVSESGGGLGSHWGMGTLNAGFRLGFAF